MQYIKEYVLAVAKKWVMLIFIGGDCVAIISGVLGETWLIPWWAWLIIGTVALASAQFQAYKEVREDLDEATNEVRGVIRELEREVISLGGKGIRMTELFYRMGWRFLLEEGIRAGSIPGAIYEVVEGADKDECDKAWGYLTKKLRLLQLICDQEYPHPFRSTGYVQIRLTSLGTSVLNELYRRWRYGP